MFDRNNAYNDLPLLPLKDSGFENILLLKKSIEVRSRLAELNAVLLRLPNVHDLNSSLFLMEAKESSAIENIVTTADEVFTPIEESAKTPLQKEVERYNKALYHGFKYILDGKPICTGLYEELVKILKKNDAGVRKSECFLKTGKVDKYGNDIRAYTPPCGEQLLRDMLKNLDDYLHYSKDDDLIKVAVIHYQFVAIHPFLDGNGRTVRILSLLYLFEKMIVKAPILFLSYHILQRRDEYYTLLQKVTENDAWDEWITYIMDIIGTTAETTKNKINKIVESRREVELRLKEDFPTMHTQISYLIFQRHYVRINDLVEKGLGTRKTVSKYLAKLEDIGVLHVRKVGREKLFLNVPYFKILKASLE